MLYYRILYDYLQLFSIFADNLEYYGYILNLDKGFIPA
jgi:hypothetical protein